MDAENIQLQDENGTFDFVWIVGTIKHHPHYRYSMQFLSSIYFVYISYTSLYTYYYYNLQQLTEVMSHFAHKDQFMKHANRMLKVSTYHPIV